MTPQARLSAAVEVLDHIADSRASADAVLKAWGRTHRFAGSSDRRAIAERVYTCLRGRARYAWRMAADDGRALVLGSLAQEDTLHEIEVLFTGERYAPAPLTDAERDRLRTHAAEPAYVQAGIPAWLVPEFEQAFGDTWIAEAHALVTTRAPVDLRVNTLKATRAAVEAELEAAGVQFEPTHLSDVGLRLHPETDVQSLDAFKQGRIEIQDESSQIAAWLSGAQPGMTVIDYCAGGGGKTLALATLLSPNFHAERNREGRSPFPLEGGRVGVRGARETGPQNALEALSKDASAPHAPSADASADAPLTQPFPPRGGRALIACDVDRARLDNIKPRLLRAGATAELRPIGLNGEGTSDLVAQADIVFVDAPCSGSGTWRRRPEDPWRLTPDDLARLHALQLQILTHAATLVAPGGRLVYATCSILPAEDEATASAFQTAHPHFHPVPIAQVVDPPVIPGLSRDIPGLSRRAPNLTPAARTRLASLAGEGHMLRLSPRLSGTDGFFIALYQRTHQP